MTIFKNYTYSWWQLGLFKLSLLCFGGAIGAYWQEVFSRYIGVLVLVGLLLALYIMVVSIKQK